MPFLGVSGFAEVATVRDGDRLVLSADLPRLTGDLASAPMPREVVLKLLRAASAEGWRFLFDAHVRKAPAWPDERAADFDALLARTIAEGPPTLFLIPDDFFPIVPLLEEPIVRAYARWNRAADVLLEGKKKDSERQELFLNAGKGDFWSRYPAIVGVQMTDALLRLAGREKYLSALAGRPARRRLALSRGHERQAPAGAFEEREEGAGGEEALAPCQAQRTGSSGNAVASGGSSGGFSPHSRSFWYV